MIIKEYYTTREDGVVLNRIYSDLGVMILQENTNSTYSEAIDVESSTNTYVETDTPIKREREISFEELATMLEEVL